MGFAVLNSLTAQTYSRHSLHLTDRDWCETNCYTDLWIEIVHSLGLDPLACLPFTVAVDFEGDQWTFAKPSHADLYTLYGIDVQELNVWRSLEDHIFEQVQRHRLVLAELDAFYLPDTHGTDYRTRHAKTTVGINLLDPAAKRMGYFHNAGYFEVNGEDYRQVLSRRNPTEGVLPSYVEFAKVSDLRRARTDVLVSESLALLRKHLARAPKTNPADAFAHCFVQHVDQLQSGKLQDYHVYAFATLRQLGSAFELASEYLMWLERGGERNLAPIVGEFKQISATAKAMILKTARAVMTQRTPDFGPMLTTISSSWESGMGQLQARYGG
ncbi:MAG: DUF1839 family protein [Chloroflexota bacterium]